MMDERTKEILKTVSDWDGEPEEGVAYNIRENGQCAGRQSSPHISIESKEDGPGLIIRISPKAQKEKVYIPACVTHGGVIRAVTAHILHMPLARWRSLGRELENCGITELSWDEKRRSFTVERFNDYAHLEAYPELLRSNWKETSDEKGNHF